MFYRASTVKRMQREHREELRRRDEQIEMLLGKILTLADHPEPLPFSPPLALNGDFAVPDQELIED